MESRMSANHLILVSPFSSWLQSFLASGSFPMSQLFASGGQSIGASASASVLPKYIQGWFPSGLTGLIFLHSKGLSRVFSSTAVQKHQFFHALPSLRFNLSHPNMTIWKTITLTGQTFVGKAMSLLFNMLSMFVITFLPRRKHFLISLVQSPFAVIFESKKIKSVTVSTFPPSICH